MNYLKILSMGIILIFSLAGCDEDINTANKKTQKNSSSLVGDANLIVGEKKYKLSVSTCSKPTTNTYDGETISTYKIHAKQDFDKKRESLTLSINGEKEPQDTESNGAYLTFELGGEPNITLTAKMPYSVFNGKKLQYKGKATMGVMFTSEKQDVPFEITVNCDK